MDHVRFDLTASTPGLVALGVFAVAYLLVVHEERLRLRKSKPVVIAGGIIWILVALAYAAHPDQWLLLTLTAGVGGSLLSVGSAAGVALMGTAHGIYTFRRHLRHCPAILAGYVCSIATHWLLNAP